MDEQCKPARSADELARIARAAIGSAEVLARLTPILPGRWPEPDGTSVLFVYESVPAPGGSASFDVRGPIYRITFSRDGEAAVEKLDGARELGIEQRRKAPAAGLDPALERAQEALLEVLAGCRSPESARPDLGGYRMWLSQYPVIAVDLQKRAASFLDWLP
jgi:hypothetical protein